MNAKNKRLSVYKLTAGALYVAVFALAGNVPFLAAIQVIPGVPITLQTFLIAMMGLTLGLRGGTAAYTAILLLTLAGLPMMSGGRGGAAVLFGPTGGYIIGFFFMIVLLGLYSDFAVNKIYAKNKLWLSIHVPVSFAVAMTGMLIDYLCGTFVLILSTGQPWSAFPAVLISNALFLPGDCIKLGLASLLSMTMAAKPMIAGYRMEN